MKNSVLKAAKRPLKEDPLVSNREQLLADNISSTMALLCNLASHNFSRRKIFHGLCRLWVYVASQASGHSLQKVSQPHFFPLHEHVIYEIK